MSGVEILKPAPAFNVEALLPNGEFGNVTLEQFKGKYLVVFFYPLDFTFVCPTEILAFNDRAEEFRALNCEVVGVSTDSKFAHHAWVALDRKKGGIGPKLNIPLLADTTQKMTKDYGCYLSDAGHALRGLYLIDGNGIVQHVTLNAPPVGRSVDEVLRLVKAFQFVEKHGEVCPAGWQPGKATIKPTPQQKGEFFAANA